MRGSVMGFDDKIPFEDNVSSTRTTPATKLLLFLSQKLKTWGVEERGAYHILNVEPDRPDQRAMCGILRTAFTYLPLDRHPTCRRRG